MTELSKLIESASRANRGRSMQAAADRATQLGCPISKSHISKNAKSIESITPQLVRGIAAGYDISEEDVVRAALADLGFAIMDYNPAPESAIRRDPNLSMEARAMLLAALQAARDSLLASGAGRPATANERKKLRISRKGAADLAAAEAAIEDRNENRQ